MPTAAALEPQKLPDTSHVDFARVYEPSDDTFLLVDALTADAAALRAVRPAVCVEVGSGSGAVVTHLGRLLAASAPPPHVLATDVNRTAALATAATAAAAGVAVHALHADLLRALRPGSVDVVVFNPPYVPTSAAELAGAALSNDIALSWAGGARGRVVTDRLLNALPDALAPRALFYLLGAAGDHARRRAVDPQREDRARAGVRPVDRVGDVALAQHDPVRPQRAVPPVGRQRVAQPLRTEQRRHRVLHLRPHPLRPHVEREDARRLDGVGDEELVGGV